MSLTTRHTITVELDIDWEAISYSGLPEEVVRWSPRDVENAITAGHARLVRSGVVQVG